MSNYPQSNDPRQPGQQSPQGEQGKLVLGGFQDSPGRPQRQPYQYRASQAQQGPVQHRAPAQQGYAQNQSPYQQQSYGQAGLATPGGPPYPPEKLAQPGKRRNGRSIGCLSALVVVVVLAILLANITQHVLAFGSAISKQPPLSTQTGYMSTSDRTNLLVMGYGGGSHDGAYLTDSMMVISMLPQSQHTSLISVPRDLWVQYPANSGSYTKINAIYTVASNNNKDPEAGGQAVYDKVSLITGLDVKYWMTIDFTGFKKVIDSVGGVDVAVPDSFNACYPKNDDASVDPSWVKVQFNKGMQHMDGATAISYARAREPLEVCGQGTSENPAELTDFGRSARQQIIIKAVLAKAKQVSAWPSLYSAMDALKQAIHTNMSLADLAEFSLKMDLNDPKTAHIGLSNQNVLQDSQSSDGQYILKPANGDWSVIAPYIKQHLYN